jgi:hypothetical protein
MTDLSKALAVTTEGDPLPEAVRGKMEAFFGADLSDVRVHTGPGPEAIGVDAFACGSAIHFAPGKFDPAWPSGERILAHELVHVLQQRAGRTGSEHASEPVLVDDYSLEVEAHYLGDCAAAFDGRSPKRMRVHPDGRFHLSESAGVTFQDLAAERGWGVVGQRGVAIQHVIQMPAWWSAPVATSVEGFVTANLAAFPANTVLYHGTTAAFHRQVTGFAGGEAAWVGAFFQSNLGQNTACGAGIYGSDSLAQALGYGASVMKVIGTTIGRSRYIDITGNNAQAYQAAGVNAQDVRRHAYRCIVRYTQNYFAVKDHRVEWESQ